LRGFPPVIEASSRRRPSGAQSPARAAPVSSVNVSVSLINTTTVIEITSNDGLAGIDSIAYRLNGGGWWLYTGPFTLFEGDYNLEYNATDLAGNVEQTKSITFTVEDITPPTTTIFPDNSTVLGGTFVSLYATDDYTGTGVSMILYNINGGDWIVYQTGFELPQNGTCFVYYYAIDDAGNVEFLRTKTYDIVKEIIAEEEGNSGGSGKNSGSSGSGKITSYLTATTAENDYLPSSTVKVSGTLNGEGNYASGKLIFVEFDGNIYNATTNDDGVFTLDLNGPQDFGNYSVQVRFEGDSDWKPTSCVCNFIVVEQDSILTMNVRGNIEENNNVTINLKLKTEDGQGIPNEEIWLIIYAQIMGDTQTESLASMGESVTWDIIYETFVVTDEYGNTQLLFIVPTSQDIKIEAVYDGCTSEERGYIGAAETVFIEGQPQVVDLGLLTTTSDMIIGALGVIALIGAGTCLWIAKKAGIFYDLRNKEVIAFADEVKSMLGKRKTILLDEIALSTGLNMEEVADRLASAISLGELYGFIDMATSEFMVITYQDEHELKDMLGGYVKHHKGVIDDINKFAKRCKMTPRQLLHWLRHAYNNGVIRGIVRQDKKDPDRYKYVIPTKIR